MKHKIVIEYSATWDSMKVTINNYRFLLPMEQIVDNHLIGKQLYRYIIEQWKQKGTSILEQAVSRTVHHE